MCAWSGRIRQADEMPRAQGNLSMAPNRPIPRNGLNMGVGMTRGQMDQPENLHAPLRKEATNGKDDGGKKRPKVKAKREGLAGLPGLGIIRCHHSLLCVCVCLTSVAISRQ